MTDKPSIEATVVEQAAGKMTDPSDAIRYLDLTTLTDTESVSDALDQLVSERPYLAAPAVAARAFPSADLGVRTTADAKPQLTRGDLSRMTPTEIEQARLDGQLDTLLGR